VAERARSGPHAGQPVQRAGEPLEQARAALILLHGRGATAGSILALADEIGRDGFAYLAPQAAGHTWYPYPFTAPLAANEPFLSSALALVGRFVAEVMEAVIPAGRIALAGFRMGLCLALEHAARHARAMAGCWRSAAGLIGPDDAPRDYAGALGGTPVFIGCGDRDAQSRCRASAQRGCAGPAGRAVTRRIYPAWGTPSTRQLSFARALLSELVSDEVLIAVLVSSLVMRRGAYQLRHVEDRNSPERGFVSEQPRFGGAYQNARRFPFFSLAYLSRAARSRRRRVI